MRLCLSVCSQDMAARDYLEKVQSGEEPRPELPALDAAAASE